MSNIENFFKLVSKEKTQTLEKVKERIRNRAMLRASQQIAIKVLEKLDDMGWSQKDLANALQVSPQQVNKIVKGSENLTLETLVKLQNLLEIPLLADFYEKKMEKRSDVVFTINNLTEYKVEEKGNFSEQYSGSKIIKMERPLTNKYSYQAAAQ